MRFRTNCVGDSNQATDMLIVSDYYNGLTGLRHFLQRGLNISRLLAALLQKPVRSKPELSTVNGSRGTFSLLYFKV